MKEHLIIFDTTLRDGEQSPGASMTKEEKVRIARQLERMRVDIIEAGFPAASNGDFDAVKAVADSIRDSTVCGLARAIEADIKRAGEALRGASSARIHTFIATSPIHMEKKLRMSPDHVVEQAVKAVKWARQYTDDVEFSPEDAGRSDISFLCRVLEAVINAGARTLNIPDTVGYTMPEQFGKLIHTLRERIPATDKVVFSVHCHNDLGLAVANSLSAVSHGARQVECTVNGLGERAGNASLEEIVMAVRTRQDYFECDTRIDTVHIVPTSKLVSGITGFPVQPNKAIVGANAFAHESGIHQDGVLKHRETYEIMRAEDVGWGANKLLLGKHSGRNAFRSRLAELGIELESEEALNTTFMRFKELADKKHDIFDEDLYALISDDAMTLHEHYKLLSLTAHSETGEMPHASIVIAEEGRESRAESDGSGPVDATFRAIEKILGSGAELQLFSVNAITSGTDSQGEVTVRLQKSGRIVNGNGADTDIVVASAKAYLSALNKLHSKLERAHPQV
ncbi:2-isopropylmalate synthase [Nitrosospira sp. Is2]|uniref:2-isopropylmalate synthase n=1 Tax=Nitrosospira sp. Is2 TaxID=3080532 RepID=UPI0029558B4B|nr:2-isopropylmalate synthase [Nitrosospira sp. Is2]WON74910.1 2-isopropylmalate synthase [Nitrosospira sp. Is2]